MTGVSAATLRAWERRYGIPSPQRTASAYRLYTDRDVELIKRVRELCDGGIAPAQAAQMVQAARGSREESVRLESDTAELATQKILAGIERFDADMVEAAVRHAMFLGSASTLFDRVFAPVMAEVGDRWHAGTMSIGQEHLATEAIGAATHDLLRLMRPGNPSKTMLVACFAGDDHSLPALGVALGLSEWNVRSVVLGARTPPAAIQHAVAEVHPDVVGLSLTTTLLADEARPLLAAYAEACGRTPWIVGGQGAADMRGPIEAAGGVVAPTDRTQLRALLERLTSARPDAAPARAS
jgi:DNA-binding transcriptional MerR regulator/methylmalonyl-CoA mutase cobalamin-binding subunit